MLKVIFFFTLSLAVLICPFYISSQEKKPFEFADIKGLLKSGVISSKEIKELIDNRGINFVVTDEEINILTSLGADDDVVNAIREASAEYEKKMLGDLYVESDPPGAKITIDGNPYAGKTPLRIERLPSGTKKLIVSGVEGYRDYEGEVTIEPLKTASIKVKLPPLSRLFSITVSTDIPYVKVYLTGDIYERKDMGITGYYSPLIVKNLKQGEYTIEIEKEGYLPLKEKIYLNKDKRLEYILETAKTTLLTIKTRPSEAEVYINEKYKGLSPLTIEVQPGSHIITVKKYSYKDGIRLVFLKDKEHKEIDILMQDEKLNDKYPKSKESEFAREKTEELLKERTVIKVKQITGDVVTVDAKSNTLKVKGKKGDVIIICDDKTKIMAGNEKKAFEDIEISDKVTVKYTENDGKNVAKSIAIKQAVKKDKNRDEKVEDKSEEKNGWISVMSYPKGTVFINGREMGYTPLSKREIPVGQHEILVRANDNEQKRVVIVRENETVEVSFQFDKAY